MEVFKEVTVGPELRKVTTEVEIELPLASLTLADGVTVWPLATNVPDGGVLN